MQVHEAAACHGRFTHRCTRKSGPSIGRCSCKGSAGGRRDT